MCLASSQVDVVVLARDAEPLNPEVEQALSSQDGVEIVVHRVVGDAAAGDRCSWDAIARARNEGKRRGRAAWLMFIDDDVVLGVGCVSTLVDELSRRPMYAALAADYLGERRDGQVAGHVAMGATLFRREALSQIDFRWRDQRCECQCCCDDLRRLRWAVDYSDRAQARHLRQDATRHGAAGTDYKQVGRERDFVNGADATGPATLPSICLVACYFGPLPGWINHFLASCARNPTVDFLVFTDQADAPSAPLNVRLRHLNKSTFEALAAEKLGVNFELSHARKLSDFKPAYGRLFEEDLKGCDYWGYTDLDVIYGDLRKFVSRARLEEYDVFSARREYLVGHFTLFRNSAQMRTLYEQSDDFRATLQSPLELSFDECGKLWGERLRGEPASRRATCDSMTHVVERLAAEKKIAACFAPAAVESPELSRWAWRLRWQAGRLWRLDKGREAMYFHFHAFKHRPGYWLPPRGDAALGFDMTPYGIEEIPVAVDPSWR